jgi:uncharacterized protein (TIGR02284 family)
METATVEKPSKQLKELIIINNDRYEGYKTATEETKDSDLKALFTTYSQQSKQFGNELQKLMPDHKYEPSPGETKNSGKLYRIFMDFKNTIRGKDRKGILASCEFGEDEAKKVYDNVLQDPEGIDKETLMVIERQRNDLQKSHDKIKAMRDSA